MIKKTIEFTDFNGVKQVEDHYFNLTKSELFKMEVTAEGNSLQEYASKIVAANKGSEIMDLFDKVLAKAYGIRSEDGKRFMKSEEIYKAFAESAAYDAFFFELVTDADKMAKFFNGVVPADVQTEASSIEELKAQALAAKGGHNKPTVDTMTVVKDVPTESAEEKDISQLTREQLEARLNEMGKSDLK